MFQVDEFKQLFWIIPRRRLRALFRRRDLESELDEELHHYISLRADQLVAEGLSPMQARETATREFGGIEQVKEECRDARGVRYIEEFWQDTGYAIRALHKTPAFAFGAISLLALGIAANFMAASLVNTLFFTSLNYRAPQQLVFLSQEFRTLRPGGGLSAAFSLPEVSDLQKHVRSLEQSAAVHYTMFNATGPDWTERVRGATVSRNLFTILGRAPLIGNVFDSDHLHDPGVDDIVISERLWRALYASDPALVGKQIRIDGRLRRVLGIMPADFEFPLPDFDVQRIQLRRADIWQPIAVGNEEMQDRGDRTCRMVGRLKGDASLRDLNRELDSLGATWRKDYGSIYQTGDLHFKASALRRQIGARIEWATLVFAIAVLTMWLISVANLMAMLLARAATTRRQMAIRMALGAGPLRLLRQAMSEGVLLAIFGGVAGIVLGCVGVVSLRALGAQSSTLLDHLQINSSAVLAAVVLLLVTTLVLGLLPGVYAVRHATADALKDGRGDHSAGLHSHRLRDQLVIGETALAFVLLVGAGLLTKSFLRLQEVDPGFKAAGVVTLELSLPEATYPEASAVTDFFSRVARDVALQPGVSSAAFVSFTPFSQASEDSSFAIEDGPSAGRLLPPDEDIRIITSDYFRVLDVPLLSGRVFAPSDNSSSELVVVVNQALARRYWQTDDVVGKRIRLDYPKGVGWRRVVGVVGNIKHSALDAPAQPELYIPHTQMIRRRMVMAIRTDRDPRDAIAMMRDRVHAIDSQVPVANARALGQAISDSILPRTLTAKLVAAFAMIGLLLAVAGIYAVVSYTIIERKHEVAIRMAVGANRGNIIGMVLKQIGRLLLAGTMVGFAIAVGASFLLRPLLYEVPAFDIVILFSMLGFLNACGLIAAYLPARWATRLNLALTLAHD